MTLPVKVDDLVNAISKTRTLIKTSGGNDAYLRLSKGGFFVYGADDTEVEEDSKWAVNPHSFMLGYVAWPSIGTGKPLGEQMRSIVDDPVAESSLPDVDGSWVQQVGMQLVCISGEDKGTQVQYKASSKGGIGGFNDFLNHVMTHLKANSGTEKVVPVITLESGSYKHPDFGKIYTPEFHIVSWSSIDEMPVADEPEGDQPEEEPAPEPKKKPKAEAKKPVRRRRRKAPA